MEEGECIPSSSAEASAVAGIAVGATVTAPMRHHDQAKGVPAEDQLQDDNSDDKGKWHEAPPHAGTLPLKELDRLRTALLTTAAARPLPAPAAAAAVTHAEGADARPAPADGPADDNDDDRDHEAWAATNFPADVADLEAQAAADEDEDRAQRSRASATRMASASASAGAGAAGAGVNGGAAKAVPATALDPTPPSPGGGPSVGDWSALPHAVLNKIKTQPAGERRRARMVGHTDEESGAKSFRRNRKAAQQPGSQQGGARARSQSVSVGDVVSPRSGAGLGGDADSDVSARHAAFFKWAGTPLPPLRMSRSTGDLGDLVGADIDTNMNATRDDGNGSGGGRKGASTSDAALAAQSAPADAQSMPTHRLSGRGAYGSAMRSVRSVGHVPWAGDSEAAYEVHHTVLDSLTAEIRDFVAYTGKIVSQRRGRVLHLVRQLQAAVTAAWPDALVEVYGSFSTGLWLPSSDVDVVIVTKPGKRSVPFGHRAVPLRRLARELHSAPWVASKAVIDSAKVPVLKLVSTDGTPVDITFEPPQPELGGGGGAAAGAGSSARVGCASGGRPLHNGSATREFVRRAVKHVPQLRPLVLVLKQYLREQGLNEPFNGGLSSYSVTLMVLSFLQMCQREAGDAAAILAAASPAGVRGGAVPVPNAASLSAPAQAAYGGCGSAVGGCKPPLPPRAAASASPASAPPPMATTAVPASPPAAGTPDGPGSGPGQLSPFARPFAPPTATPSAMTTAAEALIPMHEAGEGPPSPYRDTITLGEAADGVRPTPRPAVDSSLFSQGFVAEGVYRFAHASLPLPPLPRCVASRVMRAHLAGADVRPIALHALGGGPISSASASASATTAAAGGKAASDAASAGLAGPRRDRTGNLGLLLYRFLQFYGVRLDYRKHGASVRQGGFHFLLGVPDGATGAAAAAGAAASGAGVGVGSAGGGVGRKADVYSQAAPLVLEDPLNPLRSVAASSYNYGRIASVFEDCAHAMARFRPTRFRPTMLSCLLSQQGFA